MYTFPFTDESVINELCVDLCAYRNEYPTTEYHQKCRFKMHEDHTVTGHANWTGWEVDKGILYILDVRGSRSYRIDSLETANEVVYPMGESLREAKSAFSKFVIAPARSREIAICISSHEDYYRITLPRLLKSLKRIGFTGPVRAAVADQSKHPNPLEDIGDFGLDLTITKVSHNKFGYTALLDVPEGSEYIWLSLHDTCELTPEFMENVKLVDFSLNPDYVLAEAKMDIGFYSPEFIDRVRNVIASGSPAKIRSLLRAEANKWIAGPKYTTLRDKDVYGSGVKRSVLLLEVGIKKYIQSKQTGAMP